MCENVAPVDSDWDPQLSSSAVAVCWVPASFWVHVTISPTEMVTLDGLNAKFWIDTLAEAAVALGTAAANTPTPTAHSPTANFRRMFTPTRPQRPRMPPAIVPAGGSRGPRRQATVVLPVTWLPATASDPM